MSSAGDFCDFWKPGRLWSLWDMMKKLNGSAFGAFALVVSTGNKWALDHQRQIQVQDYDSPAHAYLRGHAATLAVALREVELDVFANAADALVAEIDKAESIPNDGRRFRGQNWGSTLGHLNHIVQGLPPEMAARHLLVMSPTGARLYAPERPLFGQEVATKFSSDAAWEIEEAGKCLALGRDTACVFHLMRAMEVALEAVRLCLQLPDPLKDQHKAWGTILKNYKKELEGRDNPQWPRQWRSPDEKQLFGIMQQAHQQGNR